jgi:hypothetical protein
MENVDTNNHASHASNDNLFGLDHAWLSPLRTPIVVRRHDDAKPGWSALQHGEALLGSPAYTRSASIDEPDFRIAWQHTLVDPANAIPLESA